MMSSSNPPQPPADEDLFSTPHPQRKHCSSPLAGNSPTRGVSFRGGGAHDQAGPPVCSSPFRGPPTSARGVGGLSPPVCSSSYDGGGDGDVVSVPSVVSSVLSEEEIRALRTTSSAFDDSYHDSDGDGDEGEESSRAADTPSIRRGGLRDTFDGDESNFVGAESFRTVLLRQSSRRLTKADTDAAADEARGVCGPTGDEVGEFVRQYFGALFFCGAGETLADCSGSPDPGTSAGSAPGR